MNTDKQTMQGKPVFEVPAKSIINFKSGFAPKLLCDGPTFSTGTSCVYTCSFCYVPSVMAKLIFALKQKGALPDEVEHEMAVIRRKDALETLIAQLITAKGKKFTDPDDNRVIYASPLVDVAANMELVRETVAVCSAILELTHWQIRLLSKSNLLPKIAEALEHLPHLHARKRVIYGVSTGTFDDKLAKAFEEGTPLVSKRLESLYWLQDQGFRTFGMICPSLPEPYLDDWARRAAVAIRADKCEHVWAEVINVRGDSMSRTVDCLRQAGFERHADDLHRVSTNPGEWEQWSRATFLAHATVIPADKLRFLQYVNPRNLAWWKPWSGRGAVLLGKTAHEQLTAKD